MHPSLYYGEIAIPLLIKLAKLCQNGQKLNTIVFWPTITISLLYFTFLFHDTILSFILNTTPIIKKDVHFYVCHFVTTSPL